MRQVGKVALVTGVSKGIGQASANALRQAGFRVLGTSRRAGVTVGDGITMITCDVTDDTSLKKAVDKVFVIAENVIEAATSVSPRRRYTCGEAARQVSVLRRFVPERMFDKSLRKQMRLPA
ncbi:MAG: SDR family NAD(P)-dependent oxidoreductase [Candidatus Binataceae bacterium]